MGGKAVVDGGAAGGNAREPGWHQVGGRQLLVVGQLEAMRESLDGARWGGRQLLVVGQLEAMRENLDSTRWRRRARNWTALVVGGGFKEGNRWA